jgi:ATP-dependent RNA helicase RhlE
MYFDETELNDHVLDALYDMHFDECTPIQERCIAPILEGRDLLGVAQTGTGKTAAYLLPILSKLDDGGYPHDAINCVIMSPTRELAQQIDQAMQGFGYYLNGVSSVAVYGGNDGNRYDQELKSFEMGADVVIATPGRLISHLSLGSADLSKVSFFVLDEADRMLDMGFSEDIKMIASKLPATCQTIMFSATMPPKIEELAKTLLKNPVEVKIAVSRPAEKIKQSAFICYETQKIGIIKEIFKRGDLNRVIIFSGKKQKVKAINRTLQQMKINSGEMHSDLEQAERDEILYKFKSGQIDVLVATDIVARGIDIDDIAMVINFDVPHDPEDYVHRIGRTARADRDGVAMTFVSDDEISQFKQIEKFLDREVEKNALPEGLGDGPDYNAAPSKRRDGRNGSRRGREDGKKSRQPRQGGKPKSDRRGPKDASAAVKNDADKQPKAAAPVPANAPSEQPNAEKRSQKQHRNRPRKPQPSKVEAATAEGAAKKEGAKRTENRQQKQGGNRGNQRRQNQNRRPQQPSNRPAAGNAPKTAAKSATNGEASALKKILTNPLKWIKSIGKKD